MNMKFKVDQPTTGVAVLGLLILLFGGTFLGGWVLMLLLGMFAGYMGMPGLAIGYWAALGVRVMVNVAFIKVSASSK